MRRVLAVLFIAVILLAVTPLAGARDRAYDLSRNPNVIEKLAVMPGSVIFFGINPLRYPNWTVKVDDKLLAGPSAQNVSPLVAGSPIATVDTDTAPTPISTEGPPDPFLPPYDPVTEASSATNACDFSAGDPSQPALDTCTGSLKRDVPTFLKTVETRQILLRRGVFGWNGLVTDIDAIVANAGPINTDADFKTYRDAIKSQVFDNNRIVEVVQSVGDLIDYPVATSADITARVASLLKFAEAKLSEDNKNLAINPALSTELVKSEAEQDQLTALEKTSKSKPGSAILERQAALKARIAELRVIANKQKESDARKNHSDLRDLATGWTKVLKLYLAAGTIETNYTKRLKGLRDIVGTRARRLSLDRFGVSFREDCAGLAGGRREKTYTVSLYPAVISQIRAVCHPRMFLSGGVAFSGLAQPTFGLVKPPAPTPTPASAATTLPNGSAAPQPTSGPSQIQAVQSTKIRTTAVILNNIRLSAPDKDDGLYASFGLGVQLDNATGGLSSDYLAGISYSFSKTMVLTLGTQLGQKTELAPGYAEGMPVGDGTQIQTVKKIVPKFFIGFTFGRN